MSIHYTPRVSNARFMDFLRVLLRWRGSVWKCVIPEFCIWLIIYFIFSIVYRLGLSEVQKRMFEKFCIASSHSLRYVPVTFILGFYVSFVMSRWWFQYSCMGWIDDIALSTASWINGTTDKARIIRRSIVRYMLLYQVLVHRNISIRLRKIYPTIKSLFDAGYITAIELPFIEDTKFWLPVKWAFYLTRKARHEGLIDSDKGVSQIYGFLGGFRGDVIRLWLADWVPVPLVYTQVTLTCVRVFFLVSVFGRQYLDVQSTKGKITPIDAYIPFLPMIQFLCFIGWVKVAEVLVNPFGEDDTDFETYLISRRNLAVAINTVDQHIGWKPPLVRDAHWQTKTPELLYTVETASIEQHPNIGSAALQKRRSSKSTQMVPRIITSPSMATFQIFYPMTEFGMQTLSPIVDNSFNFECTSEFAASDMSVTPPRKPLRVSIADGTAQPESDEPPRRFHRIASKDFELSVVQEVDEAGGGHIESPWFDRYLDSPRERKKTK